MCIRMSVCFFLIGAGVISAVIPPQSASAAQVAAAVLPRAVLSLPLARSASAAQVAAAVLAQPQPAPSVEYFSVSDYDGGNVYFVRQGKKYPYHGMLEPWVFNRAMKWLDAADGLEGAVLCYCDRSPLLLTGSKQVSRWYTGKANLLEDADEQFTRFVKRDASTEWDHAALPPLQFPIEQFPVAELEVSECTHPWQLLVVVKGRSGPPMYASPWQQQPGKLPVNLLELFRSKGYRKQFAELHFFVAVRTEAPAQEARTTFRLSLLGSPAIIASLPAICGRARAEREGVPLYAIVVDQSANRLGGDAVAVTVTVGGRTAELSPVGDAAFGGRLTGLSVGEHMATLRAMFRDKTRKPLSTQVRLCVTDGEPFGYDQQLKLLTRQGRPVGPLTGSYRGYPMFKWIGTPRESLVHGQSQWEAVCGQRHEGQYFNHGGPQYGYHAWESLTPAELGADYAYLKRCGWSLVHLCQGWWIWERLDAGGRIAPHGAEQLAEVLSAARRNGLWIHFALSHYPLGKQSKPYAQYLEAGYQRDDYAKPDSKFYKLFEGYLRDLATVFRDETALASFTAAGEGDPDCGATFVNHVADLMAKLAPGQLFMCEPHHIPKPYPKDPNNYRRERWKPLLGGMRTYPIDLLEPEHIAVQFKFGAKGHLFLAEGLFWGFLNAPADLERYRRRVRQTFYTGLVYRCPILLSWEERVVEDERTVFDAARRAIDWSKPFAQPRLLLRVGDDVEVLHHWQRELSRLPLEYALLLKDEPAPAEALSILDAQQPPAELKFASENGVLSDKLKTEMPLRLPVGYSANYSWSEDRRVLLAYIHADDAFALTGPKPQRPAIVRPGPPPPFVIQLQNFPPGKLPFRLYDLTTKTVLMQGELDRQQQLFPPRRAEDLLLVVGGKW